MTIAVVVISNRYQFKQKPHLYLEMGFNSSHNALQVFKDFIRSNCQSTRQAKIESTVGDSK